MYPPVGQVELYLQYRNYMISYVAIDDAFANPISIDECINYILYYCMHGCDKSLGKPLL